MTASGTDQGLVTYRPPRSPWCWFGLLLMASLLLVSCIEHRASVDLPDGFHVVVDDHMPPPARSIKRCGPLPQEVRVTAWRREDDGSLMRADGLLRTPLPWWQRFPADLITDILPWTLACEDHHTMSPLALPVISEQELTDEASAHGYASRRPGERQ